MFLTGAGLSVASGIAPFRGTDDAVWSQNVYEYGTRAKFMSNPAAWYDDFWLKHFTALPVAEPNAGHLAIAQIVQRFPLTRVITQNIDCLHSKGAAAIPPGSLVEIHGRIGEFKCFTENCPFSQTQSLSSPSVLKSSAEVPHCPNCSSIMCPNTLLFDEEFQSHDIYQFGKAEKFLEECDAVVFVGTSFSVSITDIAFEILSLNPDKETWAFNFNLSKSPERKRKSRLVPLQMVHGKCEETLVELLKVLERHQQPTEPLRSEESEDKSTVD